MAAGSLGGKVWSVTGGASGMGLATCRILAESKAKAICIGDFNEKAFEEVKKELHSINPDTKVDTYKLDVSSSASVNSWIGHIIETFGELDGSVNAAGVAQQVGVRGQPAILEETDDLWSRTIGVNLNGVFHCCREEIAAMTKLSKKPRSIVNIASIAALMHGPDCYGYGVSKSGVVYLTGGLAKDVQPFGIRVNCISPGATATPMLAQFFPPQMKTSDIDPAAFGIVQASDIAKSICFLLGDDAVKISGVNLPVGPGAP